jgi:Carbohydrate/starch-binding module (family 21)
VENFAYDKEVAIHGTWGFSEEPWTDRAARYVTSLTDHSEVWYFETEEIVAEPYGGRTFRFAVRYGVGGATYWDNNPSNESSISDYCVTGGRGPCDSMIMGDGTAVVLKEGQVIEDSFSGTILLANLAYEKVVEVVYTTDDWTTYGSVKGQYGFGNDRNETWYFQTPIAADAQAVKFAIAYQANGVWHWDNNFTRNYEVQRARP